MPDTPSHIQDTREWLQQRINMGPDFAGRTLLTAYNRRFGASSQQLPIGALPGLMPGMVNIAGADGDKTFHEFARTSGLRFTFWTYNTVTQKNNAVVSTDPPLEPEQLFNTYELAEDKTEWPNYDYNNTPVTGVAPELVYIPVTVSYTQQLFGYEHDSWIFGGTSYYIGNKTQVVAQTIGSAPTTPTKTDIPNALSYPEVITGGGTPSNPFDISSSTGVDIPAWLPVYSGSNFKFQVFLMGKTLTDSTPPLVWAGETGLHVYAWDAGMGMWQLDGSGGAWYAAPDFTDPTGLPILVVNDGSWPRYPATTVGQREEHHPAATSTPADWYVGYGADSSRTNDPWYITEHQDPDSTAKVEVCITATSKSTSYTPLAAAYNNKSTYELTLHLRATSADPSIPPIIITHPIEGVCGSSSIDGVSIAYGDVSTNDPIIYLEEGSFYVACTYIHYAADGTTDYVYLSWVEGDSTFTEYRARADGLGNVMIPALDANGGEKEYETWDALELLRSWSNQDE